MFVFVALFFASNGLAQKVPVSMVADASVNEDQTTMRFSRSLADEIQLSGNFLHMDRKWPPPERSAHHGEVDSHHAQKWQ